MAWILQLYDPKRPQSVEHVAPFTSFDVNYGATGGEFFEFRQPNGKPFDFTDMIALSVCIKSDYNAGSPEWLMATQLYSLSVPPTVYSLTAGNGDIVDNLATIIEAENGRLHWHLDNFWESLPSPNIGGYATFATEWLLQYPQPMVTGGGYSPTYADVPLCYKFWHFLHIRGSNR